MFAYMRRLRSHQSPAPADLVDSQRIAERSYNGGWGNVRKERRAAMLAGLDPGVYANLPPFCGTARNAEACGESDQYSPRIERTAERYRFY